MTRLPVGQKIFFALYLLILISYPGQDQWQTLMARAQPAAIDAPPIVLTPVELPISSSEKPPGLTAQAVYVFEPNSGTVLYQKNADLKLHPASTTKLMTALVALDTYSTDQVLAVRTGPSAVGQTVELQAGDRFRVIDLLYAMLVSSGNDAALTLAENFAGGYQGFVAAMNQKAQELNLRATNFSNVSGIESADQRTTVRDLAVLAKEAVSQKLVAEVVATKEKVITDVENQHQYRLYSTNLLLGLVEGVRGIKTGWTENAGECLITLTERDGKKIITVVLNSADRFGESEKLIAWAFASTWQEF